MRSYSWLLVLAQNGVINKALVGSGLIADPLQLANTRFATVVGFVHFFVMLLTLTIFANLKQLSPSYRKAAADLGAGPVQTFLHVVLPLTLPGIMVGAFLTFVLCIGDYITPQILGGNNELLMPQLVMMQIGRRGDFPLASALSIILMAVVTRRISRLRPLAEDRSGLTMRVLSRIASVAYALAIYGFIFLPVAVLVLFSLQSTAFPIPPFTGPSLRWFEAVLGDARLTSALVNSVIVAIVSSLAAVTLGFSRGLGICPLHLARFRLAARPDHAAADGELSHHRHGPAGSVQFGRLAKIAAGRRHRACRDQHAALLRNRLQPDGRASDQHRARGAGPRRARVEGAGAGYCSHYGAGALCRASSCR